MRFNIKRRYLVQTAIAVGLAPTIAASCGDLTNPNAAAAQGCSVTVDANFPLTGSFSINKPATCPVNLNGPTNVAYAATGTVPQGTVSQFQYQLSVTDRRGATYGAFVESAWSFGSNWIVSVSGTYTAGGGGFDGYNNGYDIANNQLYRNGQWVATHNKISYRFGAPGLDVSGPVGGVAAGQNYQMSGSTNDLSFVAPVSWSWYVDGTLASTSQDLQWRAGAPGSTQDILFQAVDANGVTRINGSQVVACSGTEITC